MKSLIYMILLATLLSCTTEKQTTYDLIIQNSSVIDGTDILK